jgi:hypothetical protein
MEKVRRLIEEEGMNNESPGGGATEDKPGRVSPIDLEAQLVS